MLKKNRKPEYPVCVSHRIFKKRIKSSLFLSLLYFTALKLPSTKLLSSKKKTYISEAQLLKFIVDFVVKQYFSWQYVHYTQCDARHGEEFVFSACFFYLWITHPCMYDDDVFIWWGINLRRLLYYCELPLPFHFYIQRYYITFCARELRELLIWTVCRFSLTDVDDKKKKLLVVVLLLLWETFSALFKFTIFSFFSRSCLLHQKNIRHKLYVPWKTLNLKQNISLEFSFLLSQFSCW